MSLADYHDIPEPHRFNQLVSEFIDVTTEMRINLPPFHLLGYDSDVCFAYLNGDSKTYNLYEIYNEVVARYVGRADELLEQLPVEFTEERRFLEKEFVSFDGSKINELKKAVVGITLMKGYLKVVLEWNKLTEREDNEH